MKRLIILGAVPLIFGCATTQANSEANIKDIIQTEKRLNALEFQTKQLALTVESNRKAIEEINRQIVKFENKLFNELEKEKNKRKEFEKRITEQIQKINKELKEKENYNFYTVATLIANVRKEPNLKSPIILRVNYGTKVKVIGETRYFYKVKIGNKVGYIYKTLLIKG